MNGSTIEPQDELVASIADGLGKALGVRMHVVVGSIVASGEDISFTARSDAILGDSLQPIEYLAKVFETSGDGTHARWALLFTYLNCERVAVDGRCFLFVKYDRQEDRWIRKGWESDEFSEWEDLKTLC